MNERRKVRLLTFFTPLVIIGILQTGGCLRRTPPPPPPGGTYLSKSAGASFEQSVILTGPDIVEGSHIAAFTLRGIHRPKHQPETIYIAADNQGLVVSRNGGESWEQITTPLTAAIDVVLLENGVLVATGSGPEGQGFVIRSPDDGLSWQTVLTVPVPVDQGPFQIIGNREVIASVILSIELDPFDGNRLYAGSNLGGVLVGEQSGKVWRTIHTLTPGRFDPSQNNTRSGVNVLVPSPHARGEILVITAENRLWRVNSSGQTEVTIPVEQTPAERQFFIAQGNHDVFAAAFSEQDENLLLAGIERGVAISRDGGVNWAELPVPVEAAVQFNSIRVAISPTNPNRFLVAINGVVYRSEDSGNTWNTFSLGLVSHIIAEISIHPANASRVLIVTRPVSA